MNKLQHKLPLLGFLTILLAAVAISFTPHPAAGPGAIEDMLKVFLKAIDTGDRATARACLVSSEDTFPVLIYDVDPENKPVTLAGLDAANKYLDSIFDALKKDSVKVESKITKIHADCHSPELGYATLEFTQTFTAGGKSDTTAYRGTALVTWGKDQSKGPKIFHWHGSVAKEPGKSKAEEAMQGKK